MAPSNEYERDLNAQGYRYVVGCDEAGYGPLIGDVFCGCVVFPTDLDFTLLHGLNDSKQLTEAQRNTLYPLIKQYALTWAVDQASVEEINTLNVYWAKWVAMRRALSKLSVVPDYVLMDGNKCIPDVAIPQTAIVKGDSKSTSIAAASILAKVDHDRYIVELAGTLHADYDLAHNKGYGTPKHLAALKKHGATVYHRSKFVEGLV